MASTKKCENPACSCVPPNGSKYCSPHCEGLADQTFANAATATAGARQTHSSGASHRAGSSSRSSKGWGGFAENTCRPFLLVWCSV
jgi:hypothetical protein